MTAIEDETHHGTVHKAEDRLEGVHFLAAGSELYLDNVDRVMESVQSVFVLELLRRSETSPLGEVQGFKLGRAFRISARLRRFMTIQHTSSTRRSMPSYMRTLSSKATTSWLSPCLRRILRAFSVMSTLAS